MESRFNISAGKLKLHLENESKDKIIKEDEVPTITLAPFTFNPKISFDNVTIGNSPVQKIFVENPNLQALKVSVKSLPPSERNVKINWESCIIPPKDSVLFQIEWNPIEIGSWRHTISFQFGRCLKKDLPISFQCIPIKKTLKKQIGKKKSPKRLNHVTAQQNTLTGRPKSKQAVNKVFAENKENFVPSKILTSKIQLSFSNTFEIPTTNCNTRRDTYTVNDAIVNHINEDCANMTNDSLEILNTSENNCDRQSPLRNINNINRDTNSCRIQFQSSLSVNELMNMSTETFVKKNFSTETYVKNNLSTETYVINNHSKETYVKGDISSCTYVKDEPLTAFSPRSTRDTVWLAPECSSVIDNNSDHLEEDINLSPICAISAIHNKNMSGAKVRTILEANLWGKEKVLRFGPSTTGMPKSVLKRKSDMTFVISPAKRAYLDNEKDVMCSNRNLDWNKTKKAQKNCYIGTSHFDPYMSQTFYQSEEWMEKQEVTFKNWLNALLTPPDELDSNIDGEPINVAMLWQECKKKSVPIAPSRENVCNKYHTSHRLDSLRKSALTLFRSPAVTEVLGRTLANVDNKKFLIRDDKNVHLDLGLQCIIMELLLSYNPLWLRIGLETIYNTRLDLSSNSDFKGLSNFLMQHFFKDPALLQKYKTIHTRKYTLGIKNFILKKFLSLVYFLDFAKCNGLIGHDPCLFRRKAVVKESREIILVFSRELLSSVGDVTRILRYMGFEVNHKQTYIQEFDYSVVHLGVDLRDGVRLTKVMEIILMKNNLTDKLRVPAVSRLQKIHNMKLVFEALLDANFEIIGDIGPKDIVDGHHEKTLSFLWQIIYKFQAPLMVKSSTKIQHWWRSLPIVLKRRINYKQHKLRVDAAVKIQNWFRRHSFAEKLIAIIPIIRDILKLKLLIKSATVIQSVFRMHVQQKKYIHLQLITLSLQARGRGYLLRKKAIRKLECIVTIQAYVKMWIARKRYLKIYESAIYFQQLYKAKRLMMKERQQYQNLKASVLLVQELYRNRKIMRVARQQFLSLKSAALTIQLRFRSLKLMKTQRNKYLDIKCACVTIQNYFRSYQIMKKCVTEYRDLRFASISIQRRYRANQLTKIESFQYNKLRNAVIFVQSKFRANMKMRLDYNNYINLKTAAIKVQRRYRANKLMKIQRQKYIATRNAAIFIQIQFKAFLLMKSARKDYQHSRNAVVTIQRAIRAHQAMKNCLNTYNTLKRATIIIQRKFLAYKLMRVERNHFEKLRKAVLLIQVRHRANRLGKAQREHFILLKKITIIIQRRFRANKAMNYQLRKYQQLQNASTIIQRRFRANKLMIMQKRQYTILKQSTIVIQRRFRAYVSMKNQYLAYQTIVKATITIQRRFRAHKIMNHERRKYKELQKFVIMVQRRFRANKLMIMQKRQYTTLKQSAIVIQRRFRACVSMKNQYLAYQTIVKATITIQSRFRAHKIMNHERRKYKELQKCVIIVQRRFRANNRMKIQKAQYIDLKKAAIVIQRRFRAHIAMKNQHLNYQTIVKTAITIQRRFRANKIMRYHLQEYKQLRTVAIMMQSRFRANKLMNIQKRQYIILKKSAIVIQRSFRAHKAMRNQYLAYQTIIKATITIQKRFRNRQIMRTECSRYQMLKKAVICVQTRFRAKRKMRIVRRQYENLKKAVTAIQTLFRANQRMKSERAHFIKLRQTVIIIQRRFKAYRLMKNDLVAYTKLKETVVFVQTRFRARKAMLIQRASYQRLKKSVIIIQRRFRAYKLMQHDVDSYRRLKHFVIFIQTKFRARQVMKNQRTSYIKLKEATMIIIHRYRARKAMKLEYSKYCEYKNAVITVQRRYRAHRIMKIEYYKFRNQKRAAITIQRAWRSFINGNDKYKKKKLETNAAIKLQAHWRGYIVRKSNPQIDNIRKNLEVLAVSSSSENTLKSRKDRAVQMLTNTSTLLQILRALEDLDFVTRRCRNSLLSMSKALPETLYILINSANRSPAEMVLSTVAVSILINFYKFQDTSKAAWFPSHISNLIIVMSHCCDKEDNLFPYLCTLIWLFAHNEEYKQFICSLPTHTQLFTKIKTLCLRKKNMVNLRKSSIPSLFRSTSESHLPLLTPDWGLDYADRPRTFTNSIHALKCVLNILNFTS
ncbi:hypothetical protein FQR65_LT08547 [Abscondita terminalis]|nr:hypothetical protein FQR65_LT08547 [Abscondita terminalis]